MSDKRDPPLEMIRKSFPPDVHNVWFKEEQGMQPLSILGSLSVNSLQPWSGSTDIYFSKIITEELLMKSKDMTSRADFLSKIVYEGIPPIMCDRIVRHDIVMDASSRMMEVKFQATIASDQLEEFAREFVKQTWGTYEEAFNKLLEKELA